MKIVDQKEWATWIQTYPGAHLLQSSGWGGLKSHFGWEPVYFAGRTCGCLLLLKSLPLGYKMAYLPKGPVGRDWEDLWPALDAYCFSNRVIFLKIEPDQWMQDQGPDLQALIKYADTPSNTIQPRRTIIISLHGEEEDWLKRMKQKTRYNIRLAGKKGVRVEKSSDVSTFSKLMQITGQRDEFGVHTESYYRLAYEQFNQTNDCELMLAYYQDQPLAGLMVFKRGSRSWYLFGASNNQERNRMPTYLIQWAAMQWAAGQGCVEYDLWGAPDEDLDALEAQFKHRSDGLWSVYRFKRGFGGELYRSIGAWDKVFLPTLYKGYQWLMKLRKSAK